MAPSPCESRSRSRNWRVAVSVTSDGRGAVQNRGKLVHGEGLGQVIRGSAAHGLDGGVDRAGGGHGDDRGLRVEELDLADQLQTLVGARRQVDQQDVGGAAAQHAARLPQVAGALHRIAQAGGNLGAGRAHRRRRHRPPAGASAPAAPRVGG